MQIKELEYPGNSPLHNGVIRYAMFRRSAVELWIVYCGVRKGATSTINAAEEIIETILTHEQLTDHARVRFYDLQCQAGYHLHMPGRFDFEEVKFQIVEGQVQGVEWWPQSCPNFVVEAFKDLIGPNPKQTNLWAAG